MICKRQGRKEIQKAGMSVILLQRYISSSDPGLTHCHCGLESQHLG